MAIQIPPPAGQRDQLLAVAAAAALAGIVAFYMYRWSPEVERLTLMETRVDSLTRMNEAARREVARGTASQLREEAEQYGRMLATMRQLVPAQDDLSALLDQVSTAARRTGLEVGDLAAPSIVPGEVFDTYKYQLTVTGPYHRIAQFLTNIGSMTRIVAPMNVALSPSNRETRVGPNEQLLDARFEIQTYVAKGGQRAQ